MASEHGTQAGQVQGGGKQHVDSTPPPLSPAAPPAPTNSLALLLPHQSLFAPPVLQVLKHAFEKYGTLAHWAPVRAMGRVIIVFTTDESAAQARQLDGYKLDLEPEHQNEYFSCKKPILRVFGLPPTPLDAEPDHLRPPELERNFLISPPGSPPEGWEPIVEEGPNMTPLADDLRRALEALQLRNTGGPEVIIEGGDSGVRVEVEDTGRDDELPRKDREWGVEAPESVGVWAPPSQDFGFSTPSGSVRIMPTARPPL